MKNENKLQLPLSKRMFLTLQAEEAAITAVAIYFLSRHGLGLSVWLWIPLFFSPDISMLGYLAGNRAGAIIYNLFHHRGIALLITAAGFLFQQNVAVAIGILLFAHSSFDRMMGYGLKYDSFGHTHLGWVGKDKLSKA